MTKKPKYSITKFQWISPILIMLFYIYMFGASWSLKAFSNDILGSDFLPKVVTALGFFCTFKIFIEQVLITLREKKAIEAYKAQNPDEVPDAASREKKSFGDYFQQYITLVTLALIGIYILMMKPLGFIVSTIIYLFVQIIAIAPPGKKNPIFIGILSIVFSVAIYAIFTKGFYVILPPGILSF